MRAHGFFGKSGDKMTKAYRQLAEQYGLQNDVLFMDALEMYEQQRKLARDLKADIKKRGLVVEKTYVKGNSNPSANPSIDAYNKTMTAINTTLATLKRMIKDATGGVKVGDEEDRLHEILGINE